MKYQTLDINVLKTYETEQTMSCFEETVFQKVSPHHQISKISYPTW